MKLSRVFALAAISTCGLSLTAANYEPSVYLVEMTIKRDGELMSDRPRLLTGSAGEAARVSIHQVTYGLDAIVRPDGDGDAYLYLSGTGWNPHGLESTGISRTVPTDGSPHGIQFFSTDISSGRRSQFQVELTVTRTSS
jgi:hypothetical protein